MQWIFGTLFLLISTLSIAQKDSTIESSSLQPFTREIDINFLSSYYDQDGDNAAVTGGTGSEKLSTISNILLVNIPIAEDKAVNAYMGADYYTSASSDMIDNNMSSASRHDLRGFSTLSFTKLNFKRNESYTVKVGFSAESDYVSFISGLTYTKAWNESNSELSISTQAFIDSWELIYPKELRGRVSLPTRNRQSYNGQITFSQILTQRSQMSISAEAILMKGALSTPFHRVYFSDISQHDIERLPSSRLKIPLSIRFNFYPVDNLVLRSYYRFYTDDFGIKGHTVEFEFPIKANQVLTLSPFYRYHTQTAADYFSPFETHLSSSEFYTSDFDLSALSSNKYGLGIKYYPLYGLLRSKPFYQSQRVFMMKYLEFRGAYYQRSTGLNAYIGSLNIGFGIK